MKWGWRTVSLRIPRAKPSGDEVFFIGATNVDLSVLDPALTRAGRMGRHIWFRMPTQPDRLDIFDLYLGKVDHDAELDTPAARDELARITNGTSPAQIEQICMMGLTYAQHEGRPAFNRQDLLEALVTVEAGTAIGWDYVPAEEKQIAIHEAGHAVTAHLYKHDQESTRLSVRRRGQSGGHLMAVDKEERFVKFKEELFADLICTLAAHAAEYTFYGQNTQGVGGDLQQASWLAATMVGRWGMSPPSVAAETAQLQKRCLQLGQTLVAAARPGETALSPSKAQAEAKLLGQAYVVAWNAIQHNKLAVEKIATALCERKEIYGDDLLTLLSSCGLQEPVIDWATDAAWPQL